MYRRQKRKSYYLTYGTDHSKLGFPQSSDYVEANIYTDPHVQGKGEGDDEDQRSMQSVTLIFRDGSQSGSRVNTPEKEEITALWDCNLNFFVNKFFSNKLLYK